MAVSALSRTRTSAHRAPTSLPAVVLLGVLLAPALDLLAGVDLGVAAPGGLSTAAAVLAAIVLGGCWARYPRTSWLAAAALAAIASAGLRLVGAEVGPVLSLLAVVALGTGGAFASPGQAARLLG